MKQIIINEMLFEDLMKGCKGATAKDSCRPALQYIKIENVSDDTIVAVSCNGYRASRMTFNCKNEGSERFAAYIKPFAFKALPKGMDNVIISVDEKRTTRVEFKTLFGTMVYQFDFCDDWGFDIEKQFNIGHQHDREIGVDMNVLASACKSISATVGYRPVAIMETSADKNKAFIMRSKGEGFTIEELVLPVRIYEEK